MNKIHTIVLILFIVTGCDFSTKKEIYNPDYTPEISVFSVISTDESDEFVIVERTMQLNEDDVIISSLTNSGTTIIDDAEVFIINGTDSVQFTFYKRPDSNIWDTDYINKGMYLDLKNEFRAEPGKTYKLLVKIPDGRTVAGSTTVPEIPKITQPAPWTLLKKETIKKTSIQWENNPNTTGYVVNFFLENTQNKDQISILNDHFVYESPTSLSDIDEYYLFNDNAHLSKTATIKILALDQNSFDYARKSGLAALIGTDLKLLNGGVGAFGSISVDSVKVRWE